MGFWDAYKEENTLNYVSKEEKEVLIKEGITFTVRNVFTNEGQFGPKYNLIIELDGEDRALSFVAGRVESRDRLLDAMMEYLDQEGDVEYPRCKLVRRGQSQLIVRADDDVE